MVDAKSFFDVSENKVISVNVSENSSLSQNDIEITVGPSENQSPDAVEEECLSVSGNQSANEIVEEKPLDILFPVEIPFSIILVEDDGTKGLVYSEKFCIENRGDEDVCVSIQGICEGENYDDYFISKSSVKNEFVQGKKNAWIYMQWEGENGQVLERPKVIMGDISEPGEDKIILKAPKKDKKGVILGDNLESKVYFSFFGDLNSDTCEAWKSDELKVELNLAMEAMDFTNTENVSSNQHPSDHSEKPDLLMESDEENMKKDLVESDEQDKNEGLIESDRTEAEQELETSERNDGETGIGIETEAVSSNDMLNDSTVIISENDGINNTHVHMESFDDKM